MQHDVDELIAEILRREGGFVNDPDDPGGATNFGITIGTLRAVRGQATVADVRALTKEHAAEIYKARYFYGPKIDRLPLALQPSIFDMQVNAGGNAVKILQRLLIKVGEAVSVDGALGPQSISATARAVEKIGPAYFVDAYGIERRNYYFAIADRRPASRKYVRTRAGGKGGWITRAEEFIRDQFHMTMAEFERRVQTWA